MSKAFTRETDAEDDDEDLGAPKLPAGGKNYITRAGHDRLRAELLQLLDVERPKMVEIVHWAASNGDRSENGDYLYGKKRLREIDRRIRFLTKRLDRAEVADPSAHHGSDQVFFGATVTYANARGEERTVTIKGIDESDSLAGEVVIVVRLGLAGEGFAHAGSLGAKKNLQRMLQVFWLVRLAGFEPTTPWFVAKYSIQLSYSRIMHRIIASFSGHFRAALQFIARTRPTCRWQKSVSSTTGL